MKQRFGRLDLLFNNAGTLTRLPFEELSKADWDGVVAVNLTGTFLCAQAAFRLMKEQKPQGGRIINNGSTSAHKPRPNSLPYSTTKHGITGLTKAIALDGRKYDIACGQIDIGTTATEGSSKRNAQGRLQANGTIVPEPTMGIENVARAVVFMATLPLDANVQFLNMLPPKMPYIGRG